MDTLRGKVSGLQGVKEGMHVTAAAVRNVIQQRMREIREEARRCRDSQAATCTKMEASLSELTQPSTCPGRGVWRSESAGICVGFTHSVA